MFGKKIQIDDYGRPYIIVRGKKERLITLNDLRPTIEKINLVLSHLNLEYVPETEKKEPAKLEEKVELLGCFGGYDFFVSGSPTFKTSDTKKKKRKYIKPGKYSKKK